MVQPKKIDTSFFEQNI
jgi:hypothetical protein